VSPILGAALIEAEELSTRVWHPPTVEQADALAELRVAMAVDVTIPLLEAARVMERLVSEEWVGGTAEQAACQRRLHNAVTRRR
jgi:hypothetical protein